MLPANGPIPKLSILNRHPKLLEGPRLLHQLVQLSPDSNSPAIDFLEDGTKRRSFSYDALHSLSDALASRITAALQSVKNASVVVPILIPQSPELYVALLAILKAGKAFCPIGIDTPAERLNFILKDISADLVITTSAGRNQALLSTGLQILDVDCDLDEQSNKSNVMIPSITPNDLAYVLYTSGSTGLPKAVSVSHLAVTQSLLAHHRHIPLFSRFLQFAAPTFDVSIFEIFFPLYRGCTLVGCTRASMLNDLPGVIASLRADAAELTPTVVSNLLKGRSSVPSLRLLLTIGEMLTQDVVNQFGGLGSRKSILWGMYGPTEAAIHCTLQPEFSNKSPIGNIGVPLDTVMAIIATPVPNGGSSLSLTVVPLGVVGELVIGGPQLADGYLNRIQLTAASFIEHSEFGYLYRTGDKARIAPDGTLECLGRMVAGQIKLRGQRVELGEIQSVILKVDSCHSAVAMVIDDILVAFCAANPGSTMSSAMITDHCTRWLPSHMVPSEIIILPQMAYLSSGKVDRKTMEARYLHERFYSTLPKVQSNDKAEHAIIDTLRINLGRNIPPEVDLASLGIDSLRSIRIASSLREQGFNVGPLDVLSAPNIGRLVTTCKTKQKPHTSLKINMSISKDLMNDVTELQGLESNVSDILPCTPLQEAMLAESNARPDAYCNWIEVELLQSLSFEQIRAFVEEIAHHNEIVRTGFCTTTRATTSFAQIVWNKLGSAVLQEVSNFSRAYSLGSSKSLLRPFAVQVILTSNKPRLLFQIHHALYDGWSFDLIIRDLSRLVAGHTLNHRPQYREVVQYYNQLQDSDEWATSTAYWADVLHDYHPKPLSNFNGELNCSQKLRSVTGKCAIDRLSLYGCANAAGLNPQVFFQAATAYIVGLYLGSSDVVIGTVTSGRTIPITNIEEIVGPCIASLPFRLNISKCRTILDLLIESQKVNRAMLRHCTLPLRDIAKTCKLHPGERLFDVLFVWQQSLLSGDKDSQHVRVVDTADELEFKLTLEFEPCGERILYRINYDPSIIPEKQIGHLSRQIDQVVSYFLSNIDGQISQIGQCFSTDVISIANPKPEQALILDGPAQSVEKRALETPDRNAVIIGAVINGAMCVRQTLTYSSLNARANKIAHALVEQGVGSDQLVCVLLEKSSHLYASILAVLKVGCGYLPIVPDTPTERLHRILSDAKVKLCISNSSDSVAIQQDSVAVLNLDQLDWSRYSDENLDIPYNGSHLAYAVFTSGSTGRPKGVLVTQDNLMSNLHYLSSLYPTSNDSRILQSCSQAFDVSVFEIFFSWHVGICLCTATKDDLFHNFEATINNLCITHLSLTPTVAGLIDPDRVPMVEFLVTAGEPLTENVRRKWAGRGLFQGYGPSETTNICTVRPYVTAGDLINNIGKPFPNTSALVLEPGSTTILPRGAIGELCFGGTQVFRGYLNMPELNAEKIIDHALYGRVYRSGDTGMLLPDDSILSTGRLDDQVKIRGQRVELGEITTIVLDHSAVRDCTTLLVHDRLDAQRLVTYWVPNEASSPTFVVACPDSFQTTIVELFESLSLKLPTYMVPTHLVPISRIPMTPQAKIDGRLLRTTFDGIAPEVLAATAATYDDGTDVGAFSSAELKIAEALARILGLSSDNFGRSSSFYNLGLDSISAVRFARVLSEVGLGYVPVSAILKYPTVARLSSYVAETSRDTPGSKNLSQLLSDAFGPRQLSNILTGFRDRGVQVENVLPCTPLQVAMLSSSSPSALSYYNTMIFSVKLDMARMKECWALMTKRHAILRTAFVPTDSSEYAFAQVQVAHHPVEWVDLGPSDDPYTYVKDVLPNLLESGGPPISLMTQNTEGSNRLIFCCHHALYDGVAIASLLREVEETYWERSLPDPVPYERYLRHMVIQNSEDVDAFWTKSFNAFEPTFFPDLTGQVQRTPTKAASIEKSLHLPLSEVLDFCQSTSLSLLSVIQAAWTKLLYFSMGVSDLCFGNVVSGRAFPEDDLERLVAPCFNTLPVHVNFDFRSSNSDLCKQIHSFNIDSLPFQLTSLRRIQTEVLKNQGRLFDTLVILQHPTSPLDQSIWSLEQDTGEMDLPIVCEVFQDKDKDSVRLVLHYKDSLLHGSDAEILAQIFDSAVQSLIRFPKSSANDTVGFPVQLLGQSNVDFCDRAPVERNLLHSAFEKNAISQAEATALDFYHTNRTRTTLTFKVLNEKANQIAHLLLQRGIKPEDTIPVHISKSPEFYMTILGILKAGAAFSPIHPDLPEARKRLMVSELRPKVMLSLTSVLDWADDVPILKVQDVAEQPISNPTILELRPTNLAYCLYTSGSTGTPKAVSMEHRAPIQTIESSRSLIPWDQGSRLLQYAAISFDMCYYDCFLAWTFGFTLCAAEQETMLNNLADTIQSLEVDLLDLTPSVAASLHRAEVPTVKWLYCIGEGMVPEVATKWGGACVNSYGPTEAAFCTTMVTVDTEVKLSVIGQPFDTTSFAVFPPQGERPLPVLGVGELYIGGAQLARGYYGRSELTEEKFVQKCGQRYYKSGDMVRMLSNGSFEFFGRADDQVKIRGLRVELGEISHVLQSCDKRISAANTQILRTEADSKDLLVAFLVSRHHLDEEERHQLGRQAKQAATNQLPAYMVPQFYIFINNVPRSMAGKVDKHALTKIFRESEDVRSDIQKTDHADSTQDWTTNETYVRDIFARLSKTPSESIYPSTSIYQLGLDSISAVQIAAALRRQGFHANATDVMKHVTCRDLATCLEQNSVHQPKAAKHFDFQSFERLHRAEVVRACQIKDDDIEAIRPCTPLQRGILSQFVAQEGAIYFNYMRLRLRADADLDQMRDAWSAVMRNHQMLRTGFAHIKDNKMPFLMVHYDQKALNLPWIIQAKRGASRSVEQWLAKSQRDAVKQLHRPPWCIRVLEKHDGAYLDLAILHAIFDAQSLRIIFNDVRIAYHGRSIISRPLEPILDNILQPGNSGGKQSGDFWKDLGRAAAPTRFPNLSPLRQDVAHPAVLTKASSRSLADLNAGCRKANISLQVAGIASWASLLSTYTGNPTVTFGVVLSGRNFEGADVAVFPCITTVPFLCNASDQKAMVLEKTMTLNAEMQQHQFTPLTDIQKLMGYPNEALFDTLFAYQKLPDGNNETDLWAVVDEKASIEYPLSIELEPKSDQLEYRLTFLPHVVPKEQAMIILEQLDHLLQDYVFIKMEQTTTIAKDQRLYSITPAMQVTLPSDARFLHEMVEHAAKKHPGRTALEFATSLHNGTFSSKKWTYAELDVEGNRVAHLLISYGIYPGELVGVCFDKCPEASFAMLGILKAGCAFVALDPGAPSARKAFIIKDSGAEVVLSMRPQSADLKDIKATIINIDKISWRTMPSDKPSLSCEIDIQARSYCLYTSGTTGTPKGCELTHENAVQAMLSFQRLFAGHWDDRSRWLQFASFHFDVSVLEQYWSWSVGICVVSAPRDLIFEDLASSIRTLDITHIDLTPSLARILHPDDVPSLCRGVFITGGESLKQEILDLWGPKGVIYNGYGPTEATIGVTMYPRVPSNGKPSNIGPQFENVGTYVLRPETESPVLRGGVGELCVSGKLVGKGYLSRPHLTEKHFPHLENFNERVYRTGDLVRILHDGSFDFLGRADDQIKLRGQRLEIGEINAVIKQSDINASDVATLVLQHSKQLKDQLVTFVVIGNGAGGGSRIVHEHIDELGKAKQACHDKLPPYMVPTHFVALTAMPLSVNNKADVTKLKSMYEALSANDLQLHSVVSQTGDDQCSKQEQKVLRVLSNALKIHKDFGKTTSFFELGMDSISVIGVSRALKQAGFSKAAPSVVMKNATIRRLTQVLSDKKLYSDNQGSITAAQQTVTAIQHRHRRKVAETLFMDSRNIEALAPCTPLQQGMIARSLESEHGLYFNTFCFRLAKKVDADRLQDAWRKVFNSTQILRTVFVDTEDGYLQTALRRSQLPFESSTLRDVEGVHDYMGESKKDWVQRNRFNIKAPFEIHLVDAPEGRVLIVHIFHGLYDGISIGLVFNSVWNAYNARETPDSSPFQSTLAYGPLRSIEGAKEFWEGHLVDRMFRPFPTLIDQPVISPTTTSREVGDLGDLENIRRRFNVTTQAIVQACWTNVLYRHVKSTITVGIVVSGRSIDFEGAEKTVGPLFNTIPYQYRPREREAWSSHIKRAHDFNIAAHLYQHTPLRDIMKWCKRGPSQPLFDSLFVYQNVGGDEKWLKNDAWELLDGDTEADYPLAIEIEQRGGNILKLTLVAQGHISNQVTSTQLLEQFEDTLREALNDSNAILEFFQLESKATDQSTSRGSNKPPPENLNNSRDFRWTKNATALREDIASLANVEAEDVSEVTSILELGLDSIDAIKLSSKLKKRAIELPVSGIMRSLTVANMLQHISMQKKKWNERPSDMIFQSHKRRLESHLQRRGLAAGVERILPLTPLQEAMVAEMIASNYTRYYNHDVMKLNQTTDIERLQKAWTQVVTRSPILRTSFIQVDDPGIDFSFAQVIHEKPHAFSQSIEIDSEPNFSAIFESIRQEAATNSRPGPLFHIHLIRAPKQIYLVLSIAHALYDGWSLGLLHDDVHSAFNGCLETRPNYEPTLQEILTTSGADASAFWRDYLSEATLCTFPKRTLSQHERSQLVHRKEQVSSTSLKEVGLFIKKNNITLQALGQTIYALTLASYAHSLDVTFGSVLSGRDDGEKAKHLFPTMNTVAIRTILHGTRREMLQYVQDNFSNIKQWQHFPLRKALSLAGEQGNLFESLFIYQKSVLRHEQESKLYESVEAYSDVEYPVCVEMEVVGNELVWRCAVKEEAFDDEGSQELLDRLDEVLKDIMNQPSAHTIEFTDEGTSICGLPAFGIEVSPAAGDKTATDDLHGTKGSNSTTAKAIREVLAFVSKTPEEEIMENMTIFHIGLDSISAIKVSSLLRKRDIVLGVGEMLKAGSMKNMAQIVDRRVAISEEDDGNTEIAPEDALAGIEVGETLGRFGVEEENIVQVTPATAGQVHMLSMWLNSNGGTFYPVFTYEVRGWLAFESIRGAWKALVAVNPILRTSFYATMDPKMPYLQVILKTAAPVVVDVTNWNRGHVSRLISESTTEQPHTHLYASQTPDGWEIKLKIHHALYDGVSLPILMQQLQGLCNGTDVTVQDDPMSRFIAAKSTTAAREHREGFWKNYLKGIQQKRLTQLSMAPLAKVEIFKPGLLLDVHSLDALTRKNGITTQSIFLAIYARLYASLTFTSKRADVIIGLYLANRSFPIRDIAQAAVPTVNLVPLRVSTPLETDLLEVAAQIQYDLQDISNFTNALVGLWEVEQWTDVKIDTFVNFLKLPDVEDEIEDADDTVKITHEEKWNQDFSRVVKLDTTAFEAPKELVNDSVNGAYMHAVDVEATIRNGALHVGIFAPEQMLSVQEGESLIKDLKSELEALIQNSM